MTQSEAPERMTGAQSLIRSLENAGTEHIFGIPGGAILPAYDPLLDSTRIRHILVRHEQGAGHAAAGYASATGRVGVCMATSGPGATNLVTPIADAYMDNVPIVAITGQVKTSAIGTESMWASAIGVTRLVAPGPDVAMQTPTRPVAEAYPWAAWPAPCS
jgi:acetolactate synthase-1/2/3 large subunit